MNSGPRRSSLVECNPGAEAATRARRLSLSSALLWSSEEINFTPVDIPEENSIIQPKKPFLIIVLKPILTLLLAHLLVLIESFLELSLMPPLLSYQATLIFALGLLALLVLPILLWNMGFRVSLYLLFQRGWCYVLAAAASTIVRQWPQPKWNPMTAVILVIPIGMWILRSKYTLRNLTGWLLAILSAFCIHWPDVDIQPTWYCIGGFLMATRATWDQFALQQNSTEWLAFTGLCGFLTESIRLIVNINLVPPITFSAIPIVTLGILQLALILGQAFVLHQGGADLLIISRLSLRIFRLLLRGEWTSDPWLWSGFTILLLSFSLFIQHVNYVNIYTPREIVEIIATDN